MATNRVYNVAVIPGDGIGKEVVPEGLRVLEAAAKKFGFELRNDAMSIRYPDRFQDPRGTAMWNRVIELIGRRGTAMAKEAAA